MLQLNNITKRFADGQRNLTVLDKLSLHVAEGEFVAITGESGAGKTTLLSILGTLLRADEGTYRIGGKDVEGQDIHALRNKEIGFVYQDHRLLPQFTVLQNILLPTLATKSVSTTEEEQRALRLLDFMGISSLKDSPICDPASRTIILSGGEQTRVAICRALIMEPSILLADEPTGQLDASNAQTIAELFRKVNRELHTTIVMVTHSPEMAKAAQTVYRIEKGRLKVEK